MTTQTYFVKRGQKIIGPMDGPKVKQLVVRRKLRTSDLVSSDRSGEYTPLGRVYRDVVDGRWQVQTPSAKEVSGVLARTGTAAKAEDSWIGSIADIEHLERDAPPIVRPRSEQSPVLDLPPKMTPASSPRPSTPPSGRGRSAAVEADGKFCSTCGEGIHKRAEICPSCGVRQADMRSGYSGGGSSGDEKSKIVAFILAWFFGSLGVHKFYMGRTGAGTFYLMTSVICLFTFFLVIPLFIPPVLALCAFVEGFVILLSSDESFRRRCA